MKNHSTLLLALILLPLLLLLNACAGAGNEHVRKEYYENGQRKLVVIDHNDVQGVLQKVDVTNLTASTEDEGGYKHKVGAKSLSATGDTATVQAIAAGVTEGLIKSGAFVAAPAKPKP